MPDIIQIAEVYQPIFTGSYNDIILKSGRDGGKSKTAYILAGTQAAQRPNEDIVIARASYGSISDSAYNEVCEVIDDIPAFADKFIKRKSPLRIVRKDGGTNIYFIGVGGSKDRTKGIKPIHKVSLLILEEAQEIKSRELYDQTLASLRRRFGEDCKVITIFNPPAQELHWINVWAKQKEMDKDYLVIHSTWRDIAMFLQDRDIKEILKIRKENKTYYDYMYGGIPSGAEGSVYPMFRKDLHVISAKDFDFVLESSNIRPVGMVIGGDGAVNRDATAFVPILLLSNGQGVVGQIFYHNPKTSGVLGYHQLVQDNLQRWFDDVCARFRLGTRQELMQHPTMRALPIWMRIDSAAPDLIQECRFFFSGRADVGPIQKHHVIEMVGVGQSAIANNNLIIIDYGGYYDYQLNKWVQKENNLLAEQLNMLIWNERQDNYDPIVPNDVADAWTYGNYFWFSNQENIQYFNILKANSISNLRICDILKSTKE